VLELTPTADTVITKRWSSIRAVLWYVPDTRVMSSLLVNFRRDRTHALDEKDRQSAKEKYRGAHC